jgi:hypothetical protein
MPKYLLRSFLVLVGFVFFPADLRAADTDFAAPLVTIDSIQNGALVTTKTIVVSGTATDAGRGGNGISGVYVSGFVTGSTTTGNGVVNWSKEITLNKGPNQIYAYAYDTSQNQNQGSTTITVNYQPLDSLPPAITVTSHTEGEVVNTKQITLTGTATDAGNGNNGVSGVFISGFISGTTTTGAGVVNWSKTVDLYPGVNRIYIYADDASPDKNEASKILTINFAPKDPLGPNLVITSHTNGQTVATSTITVEGTASDSGRGNNGISYVSLQGIIPNTTATGANTVFWSRSINLFPGANNIYVSAYDGSDVNNGTDQMITVNFQAADTLPPILHINNYTNGQTVFTSTITISGTATDAGRGDNGISGIYLGGKIPDSNTAGTGTVTWSRDVNLFPGKNVITVYADDAYQFPNETSQTLTINFQAADTLGPNLAITSHFDGQVVNTKTITVRGTASDAGRGDNGISAVYLQGKIPDSTATGGNLLNWSRTIDLTPGRNTINVAAYDNSPFPNETDQSITITFNPVDALPPGLVVTSHIEGQIVFTNVITVAGTASDAGRGDNGVTSVKVNFTAADGGTATGAGVANWSRTFALTPGNNNINISAMDGAEFPNQTNITLRVVYQLGDVTPPTLTIDSPRNNSTVNTSSITVSGTATDSGTGGSGIASVTLNGTVIPGSTTTGSATVNWSQAVNLQRGANVIALVATDNSAAHNQATATITVDYEPVDTLPPIITIDSHRNNQTVATSSITLAGTATDNDNGGNGVSSVTINGVAADNGTATGSITAHWSKVVNLNLGANVLAVVARDDSPNKNEGSQTITITYDPTDNAGPDIQVTSHHKEQTVSSPTIVLAGTASDAGHGDNGISGVTVNAEAAAGGTATAGGIATWSRQINLNLGLNVISVVATDNSANKNSTAQTIKITYEPVDKTAPDLEVTSHKNGQTVATALITLTGTATDADRGDNGVTVTVNGSTAVGGTATGPGTANWTQPLKLNVGENVISVVANDSKDNSTAITLVLTYDPQLAASAGSFCWVRNAGAAGDDAGYGIALDPEGNSYVTGVFAGTASFGATNLVSQGGADIFVAKYDPQGNLLWARQAGGSSDDAGLGIAVSTNGNCYVTGYFAKAAAFGTLTVSTTGEYDMFLAKYDSDGNIVWVTNSGRGATLLGNGVAIDAQENSYVAGSFASDAFFAGTQFTNNEQYDAFVAKYDRNGNLVWATQFGGDLEDESGGIAVDSSGRCYVAGYFAADAFFQDVQLTASGDHDMFLAQLGPDGKVQWVQQAGEIDNTKAAGVAVDRNGNAYVTGYYDSVTTFGAGVLLTEGNYDLFLAKYDVQGHNLWVRNTEKSTAISASSVALDADGSPYVTGTFIGPAVFGSLTLTNGSSSDIFIAKYDAAGTNVWTRSAGGAADADANAFAIAVSPSGATHIAGSSAGLTLFGNSQLSSNGKADLFVAKLSDGISAGAPQLTIQAVPTDSIQLQFMGESCSNYRLQGSGDLIQWNTLLSTNGPNGTVTYTHPTDSRYQFYRVTSP